VNFQQLVTHAEAKAANQGYDVTKLPVMTPSGKQIENVHVKTVAVGKKAVWAVVVEP
jgi:hypothetical protein